MLCREPGSVVVERCFAQGVVSSVNLSDVAAKLSARVVGSQEALEILSGLGLGSPSNLTRSWRSWKVPFAK